MTKHKTYDILQLSNNITVIKIYYKVLTFPFRYGIIYHNNLNGRIIVMARSGRIRKPRLPKKYSSTEYLEESRSSQPCYVRARYDELATVARYFRDNGVSLPTTGKVISAALGGFAYSLVSSGSGVVFSTEEAREYLSSIGIEISGSNTGRIEEVIRIEPKLPMRREKVEPRFESKETVEIAQMLFQWMTEENTKGISHTQEEVNIKRDEFTKRVREQNSKSYSMPYEVISEADHYGPESVRPESVEELAVPAGAEQVLAELEANLGKVPVAE